jgi:hypothetical protein
MVEIFPEGHALHAIVWDSEAKEYYNTITKLYLSDDDVKYHELPERGILDQPTVAPNGCTITKDENGRFKDENGNFGYNARFGNHYICYTCGLTCDCNCEDEE